jgi:hypothetical protein
LDRVRPVAGVAERAPPRHEQVVPQPQVGAERTVPLEHAHRPLPPAGGLVEGEPGVGELGGGARGVHRRPSVAERGCREQVVRHLRSPGGRLLRSEGPQRLRDPQVEAATAEVREPHQRRFADEGVGEPQPQRILGGADEPRDHGVVEEVEDGGLVLLARRDEGVQVELPAVDRGEGEQVRSAFREPRQPAREHVTDRVRHRIAVDRAFAETSELRHEERVAAGAPSEREGGLVVHVVVGHRREKGGRRLGVEPVEVESQVGRQPGQLAQGALELGRALVPPARQDEGDRRVP